MLWTQSKRNKPKDTSNDLPDIRLGGPRIFLMPPQPEHAEQWIDVRKQNKERLAPLEPVWPRGCLKADFFKKRLERQAREWDADNAYPFLIFTKGVSNDGEELIGGININHVCRGAAQYASLGYWLAQSHQGHGHMSEALQIIMKFSFDTLGLHRLNAAVLPHNERSITLLLRNGFVKEGLAEKYIKIDGLWQDHVLFGLPIELWEENNKIQKYLRDNKSLTEII